MYIIVKATEKVVENLQADLTIVLKWFGSNQMIANPRKFHYMLPGKQKPLDIEVEGFKLESAKLVKLLGLTHNLTFDTLISDICKTASVKVKNLTLFWMSVRSTDGVK